MEGKIVLEIIKKNQFGVNYSWSRWRFTFL